MENVDGEVPQEQVSSLTNSQLLFPVSISQSQAHSNSISGWLQNVSFTAESSTIDEKVAAEISASYLTRHSPGEEIADEGNNRSSYPLIPEEENDDDVGYDDYERTVDSGPDGVKKKRESERKKRRRKRKRMAHERETSSRKSNIRAWAGLNIKPSKDYYLDIHGDRDNLVYGSLYRVDVPRYKLGFASRASSTDTKIFKYAKKGVLSNIDYDIDALDNQLKSSGRYWSAKYVALERHKNFKRIRLLPPQKNLYAGEKDFLPLLGSETLGESHSYSMQVIEESWEDEVLRKTREFNKLTRERPHDLNLWIEFSEFQDKVAEKQPQKGARLQTLEKKISILENAIQLNPESEELLVHLLKSYKRKDTTSALIDRWNRVLTQRSWSSRLWKEYLGVIQGEFSRFKVSETRKAFAHAIQALSTACRKHSRQAASIPEPGVMDSNAVELELGLVDIFLSLCRFEWQAGYQELATALLQAEIEFSLLCPTLNLSEGSKLRLFEHFWISSGVRLGEEEALGWSSWLETEENERQKILKEQSRIDDEKGGWSGWVDTSLKDNENDESMDNNEVDTEARGSEDEDAEAEAVEDDDIEGLLKQLGIDVNADADADADIKDSKTWAKWAEEETSRDNTHWMPLHVNPDNETETAPGVVLFEDICDFLFSLSSKEAHLSLISQFVLFFGGEISEWICTNSSTWGSRVLGSDTLVDPLLLNLKQADVVSPEDETSSCSSLGDFVRRSLNTSFLSEEMAKFLRKALLLLMGKFSRNYVLKEAVLVAQEHSETNSRSLAKSLIKSNRQDVMLCGVYAKREAVSGNMDHARRAFDMAVSSVDGLPLELRFEAPLLFFWYAEAELSKNVGNNDDSRSRALHVLSILGCGSKYSPFETKPSSLQILRAHQGFKDKIKSIWPELSRGKVEPQSTAIICSAALFEELTSGWSSGTNVLDEAFDMIPPERRSNSGQAEFLYIFCVRMLMRHQSQCGLSKVWQNVLKGLDIYPQNPELYKNLLHISQRFTTPNKLRWLFDNLTRRQPSVVVWVFALVCEMNREGSHHRVHRLFERAFADAQLRSCIILWRLYIAYEVDTARNLQAAKRAFFRAIHACPWSKRLWLDGFEKLNSVLTPKELSDLQEVMRDKEFNIRTDIYEILLQDDLDA